ncbi:F0F1 ATP synthase subunit A [Thermodesulforhabdus norvegica]|uniref:ATP synthase subunit a n=1 Tax=Thermodesulforhabdus norvegica TaxID=39841 RepID=A0A1I4RJB3_9BACT|nr:F0F1 ATP synthase subunit A [Thermodesulforhabdus norvegica]SFM52339.1 ATP synthase F0 subcomplex A subunit [Thermodesulforhabdus norvegica]
MEELGKIWQWSLDVAGYHLVFNMTTIVMTLLVITGLLVFSHFAVRNRSYIPGTCQLIGEMFVGTFWKLTVDALDEDMAKKYFPLICALFMFLWCCNVMGIVPGLSEPTKDLNTPLGLGIMGFIIAHYAGIRTKGFKNYAKEYFQPVFFMMPLNVVGELAKVISISFRLYGNIMGGSIIILVVSYLVYDVVLPPFLYGFFGLFVGTVQAFVFTMLTLVYISVQVK